MDPNLKLGNTKIDGAVDKEMYHRLDEILNYLSHT